MSTCPVCDQVIHADDAAFAHHVNAHFDEAPLDLSGSDAGGPSAATLVAHNDNQFLGHEPAKADTACFVCGTDLSGLSELAANAHVSDCLDGGAGGAPEPDFGEEDDEELYNSSQDEAVQHARKDRTADGAWDGAAFAARGGGTDKAGKGDKWWDPVRGSLSAGAVPPNFSPGLIPVLQSLLQRSAESGNTRSAVLAKNGVHIRGSWGFDGTWGCGYRNGLMAIATTWATYSPVFQGDPGVRAIQTWIEDAWRSGFDVAGKEQLKGKLVGTRKWIGTTDLYAMFSALGISCTLYDFPKPSDRRTDEPTYKILERWTRTYFDSDASQTGSTHDAFQELMRPAVRVGTKLPFILQHAGHSRTVVGYELTGKDFNLLIYDPAKTVPKDVREAGIGSLRLGRDSPAASNDASPASPQPRGDVREGVAAADLSDSDEVTAGGWVRRKAKKDKGDKNDPLLSSLNVFRVNLGRWKAHTQYQVLAFDGRPLLGPRERVARKVVDSVVVEV